MISERSGGSTCHSASVRFDRFDISATILRFDTSATYVSTSTSLHSCEARLSCHAGRHSRPRADVKNDFHHDAYRPNVDLVVGLEHLGVSGEPHVSADLASSAGESIAYEMLPSIKLTQLDPKQLHNFIP